MFERFLEIYGPESDMAPAPLWRDPVLMAVPGYVELVPRLAGLVLGGGLLRFVTQADGPAAQRAISDALPEFSARAVPFARDWLGRHFAVDRGRSVGPVSQLLLLEPGSGEAFEIDEGLEDFLNIDLVEAPDTYLESELFELWRASGGGDSGSGSVRWLQSPTLPRRCRVGRQPGAFGHGGVLGSVRADASSHQEPAARDEDQRS